MASFYAELQIAGATYPVRFCTYEFTQATSERGRVAAKVRHGLLHLTLDVPDDALLLDWAATPYKPLAGRVVFRNAQGVAALETLVWEAGQCVGYQEEFLSGSVTEGAYVCHLTIATPQLTMQPGGPATYVAPVPGEHGNPAQALLNGPSLLLPPTTPLEELVLPTVEELTVVAREKALEGLAAIGTAVALPVVLTLALLLGSTTPAQAPGIPQPHLLPVDPDLLRLNTLAARHAAGTLTSDEEAELIALLAKVKGIHIQKLSDLEVKGPLRGAPQPLPGFYYISLTYTKRSTADLAALRSRFNSVRKRFMKQLATDPTSLAQLRIAGISEAEIARAAKGGVPDGWQVHHKVPLDDGGDNAFDNLMLIENDPYHLAITNLQNQLTNNLAEGQSLFLEWPMFNGIIYPPTPQP
jgi:hypothetical protein